jgi:hypothetical protein
MKKPNAKPPKIFFDAYAGGYWLQLSGSRFLRLSTQEVKMHLRHAGIFGGESCQELTDVEHALYSAQTERFVDYAGPLAGHRCGHFVTSSGLSVLVTLECRSSVFDTPKDESAFPFLESFLDALFGPEQLLYVLGWLKYALQTLRDGDFRPGQVLILAGPSNCGKSLFQALVTELFGGRVARPFRYMMGETAFNSDLAGAEHLIIEDEHASTDTRARRKFGTSLKDFTVNQEMSIHAKGREARTLRTFKRVTLSVNNESENLMIVPPLDESILDKVILTKCSPAPLSEDRKANWTRLTNDLPSLACYLKNLTLPRKMRDTRFGVRAYHNPELLELLSGIAQETRLLELVDELIFSRAAVTERRKAAAGDPTMPLEDGEWTGTAVELEKQLRNSPFAFAVEKLLYHSSTCGTYLERLRVKNPKRFTSRKNTGKTVWTIGLP